IETGYTIGINN
nr:parasporal crystal protein CryIA.b - Bacillus thuringiensis (fragments) [Bacillus thuringiensis]